MILPASTEATAAMLTGGVGQILFNWAKDGKQKSIDDLMAEISALIEHIQMQR